MKRMIAVALLALLMVGCTSYGDYYKNIDAANARQVEIQVAQAQADSIRYAALMKIAETGDATAKVAAAMALAFGNQTPSQQVAVPAQPQNEALQWASVLAPTLVQGVQIFSNASTQRALSDNSTRLGINTNETMVRLGTKDPVVVTQPSPIVVTQPPPLVVNPVIVETPSPIIVGPQGVSND